MAINAPMYEPGIGWYIIERAPEGSRKRLISSPEAYYKEMGAKSPPPSQMDTDSEYAESDLDLIDENFVDEDEPPPPPVLPILNGPFSSHRLASASNLQASSSSTGAVPNTSITSSIINHISSLSKKKAAEVKNGSQNRSLAKSKSKPDDLDSKCPTVSKKAKLSVDSPSSSSVGSSQNVPKQNFTEALLKNSHIRFKGSKKPNDADDSDDSD